MKLVSNQFTQSLKTNKPQVGLWVSLCSNLSTDIIAHSGYDWLLLDMEHTPNDINTVLSQLQSLGRSSSSILVRPQWNDAVLVKSLLDIGAPGLLFPMIQSVEEAERAVASTRYPPRGIRGVSGTTRATAFGRIDDYFERIEDETAVVVQLETRAAIEQADSIAAVDGVSGVFFGPADIAADIGKLGQPMCDEVWDLVLPVARRLLANGVPVGTLVFDGERAAELLNEGFSFVACGSDLSLLTRGSDALLSQVKSKIKR
ncbi:MAG: HpcH/HpaI aldolase/citrate lyase family protein [Granulosicoccus sp.]|nr:HpcH/HpaI aldolase/citrate lyase family protein [Granulosicoccus sp.]